MTAVSLEGLTKRYKAAASTAPAAIDDLDLRVEQGEYLVIVGPSGCGKTTLLRLIAGLESPDSGVIRLDGREVSGRERGRGHDLPPHQRGVAMVFQESSLYPHMTIAENISFPLKMRRMARPERDRRVHDAAAALGIADLLDRRPGDVSGGERQRAALAAAIAGDVAVILLDEPLSNLDPALRTALRVELKRLHRRTKPTIIHVTHDQEEALTLADRIVVMRRGRVVQAGLPREVHDRPIDRFVAGFIGSPPMNFIEGRLEAGSTGPMAVIGDELRLPLPAMSASIASSSPITLGIRPEHVHLSLTPAASAIRATVDVVQWRGDSTLVHLTGTHGLSLIARLDADASLKPGDAVFARFHAGRARVFEPGPDGRRLV